MGIEANYAKIKEAIPEHVTLVAVSKTKPVSAIQELYDLGHRDFGENRIQELTEKYEQLPKDIRWHMIGHVQDNKIKYIAEFVHLIHGIDKAKRLKEVQKQAAAANRSQQVLLQIHIAEEETKFGMEEAEALKVLQDLQQKPLPNVEIVGLMGMATFTEDMEQVRREFRQLNNFFKGLQQQFPQLKILSMGMSGEFETAIEEGSTMIRVGSAIFGDRT